MARLFIARHGETVFNVAGRMQGGHLHTPLTAAGCSQAIRMGKLLGAWCDAHGVDKAGLELVSSDTGRALQTLALVAEQIGADWHAARTEAALREIDMGEWNGRYYRDLFADPNEIIGSDLLFTRTAPGGESYADVAARLAHWIDVQPFDRDQIIITHGMTARVLRGLLTNATVDALHGAAIAPALAQGSMVCVSDGSETIVVDGEGSSEVA